MLFQKNITIVFPHPASVFFDILTQFTKQLNLYFRGRNIIDIISSLKLQIYSDFIISLVVLHKSIKNIVSCTNSFLNVSI